VTLPYKRKVFAVRTSRPTKLQTPTAHSSKSHSLAIRALTVSKWFIVSKRPKTPKQIILGMASADCYFLPSFKNK